MKTVDISWRRYVLPNINKEGWKFFGIFAAITALLAMIWEPLGVIGLVCTVWCYYFFRDPERSHGQSGIEAASGTAAIL